MKITTTLLHFHVVFSIWSSINIAELVYGHKQDQSWVGNKLLGLSFVGLMLWVPAGWMMTSYVPPMAHYFATIALFLALVFFAHHWANRFHPQATVQPRFGPIPFYLVGAINVLAVYFTVFIGPELGLLPPLWLMMTFLVAVNIATLAALALMSRNFTAWTSTTRIALSSGVLIMFFIVSFANDFDDGFAGSSIVVVIFILFLLQLNRNIKDQKIEPRG